MKNGVQITKKAIELRRQGYSYKDISNELKVSKTSVSNWVKNVRLTEDEKDVLTKRVASKMERGRMKASISIHSRKIFKEKVAYENAEKEFNNFIKDPLFMLGLGLCWINSIENKGFFQFISSNSSIIKLILIWMQKYLNISDNTAKYRVFIDISYKNKDCEEFWSRIVGVSHDKFQRTAYLRPRKSKDDREYKGSLAIVVTRIEILRRIIAWQKLAIRYHN